MDHRNDGLAVLLLERAHQLHNLVARRHVEKRGRLVEEHHGRILRQDHGDEGTLTLPAGELGHGVLGELCKPACRKRPVNYLVIRCVHRREHPMVRKPPALHKPPHAHGRCRVLLRQQAQQPCALFGGKHAGIVSQHADAALPGLADAACKLEQRRLAAAVGADDARHLALRELEVQPAEQGALAVAKADVAQLHASH